MIQRRDFLLGGASLLASCFLGFNAKASNKTWPSGGGWLSGYGAPNHTYGVALIDRDLHLSSLTPTPFRLHDIVRHPNRAEYCVPARRAGTHFIVLRDGKRPLEINAPKGRHFYGHGVYNASGTRLFLTENDYEAQRGAVAVYDAENAYKRVSNFDSGGIGPHQLVLEPAGQHLVVANGGILTHPASGRAKLNLDTMVPNLSLINLSTQRVVEKAELANDLQALSIRHMTQTAEGTVYFGVQDQFPGLDDYPLVGQWKPGKPLRFLQSPTTGWHAFNGYIGSLTLDRTQQIVGVTSPKNGIAGFWDIRNGRMLAELRQADICGIAPTLQANHFMISSGEGICLNVRVDTGGVKVVQQTKSDVRFDNHAICV